MTYNPVIKGKWGLSDRVLRKMVSVRNKKFVPPYDVDSPDHALYGSTYWHAYPYKDYCYQFNSYGFRGPEFAPYGDKPINVAIGDCNTLGIGVPEQHTWPYQLSQMLKEPVLNYAVNGIGYYDFAEILEKTRREMRQIRRVFVMYGLANTEGPASRVVYEWSQLPITQRIEQLKKHCWLHGAYYVFNPAWQWPTEELPVLYQHFPEAHAYMKNLRLDLRSVDIDLLLAIPALREKYLELAGRAWPHYDNLLMSWYAGERILDQFDQPIDQKLMTTWIREHLHIWAERILLRGRDGWHAGAWLNRRIALDLFDQCRQ